MGRTKGAKNVKPLLSREIRFGCTQVEGEKFNWWECTSGCNSLKESLLDLIDAKYKEMCG